MSKKRATKSESADIWYKENQGSIDWSIKGNRERFRETNYWKRFVNKNRGHHCDFCSCKASRPTLHHLYPDYYDTLKPELFATLDYQCHTKISQLSRRKDKSNIPEYFEPFLEHKGLPPGMKLDNTEKEENE